VIDSERQLSGKVFDEDTRSALERSDQMTPEQLLLIDAILTLPETSSEKELQRRIAAWRRGGLTAMFGVAGPQQAVSPRSSRPKSRRGLSSMSR
jgi:alcohol dehydrogenase YqhD (iron-dependent ADH family)